MAILMRLEPVATAAITAASAPSPAATGARSTRQPPWRCVATPGPGMTAWREHLFAAMSRNAGSVVAYFRRPDNAVVDLGTRVQI